MKNRGFALIASIFLVLFLGIFLSLALFRSNMQLRLIDTRQVSLHAFYAAEAGINDALTRLRSDPSWAPGPGDNNTQFFWAPPGQTPEQVGFYTVRVEVDHVDSGRWILSTGQDINKTITRVLRVKAAVLNPGSFFTSSMSGITIGSGAIIDGDLYARDVIFNVDKSRPEAERQITVDANVSYTRSLIGYPDPDEDVSFGAGYSPAPVAPITFTGLDLNSYKGLIDKGIGKSVDPGSLIDLKDEQGLIYVDGDVNVKGVINYPVHIVAKGNIYIVDNIETGPSGAQLGLSAGNDVIIAAGAPESLQIDAFVFADGGVFRADLGTSPKNTLHFNGAISVRGRENVSSAINLNAYGSGEYHYNRAFLNMQIPYMTYFVNVVEWKETNTRDFFPPQP